MSESERLPSGSGWFEPPSSSHSTTPPSSRPALREVPAWHSFLLLLSFPLCTGAGVLATQRYLSLPFDWLPMATMATAAFAIYAFNRFTDATEDSTNDPARASSSTSVHGLLLVSMLAIGALARELGSRGPLALGYLVGVLLVGAAYSIPIAPWYTAGGWRWLRFKDLLFVKNIVVALVWTSAFFLSPVLCATGHTTLSIRFLLLAIGFFLAYFANVLFCDFRDLEGDRAAGVRTLPVQYGLRRCYLGIATVNAVWLLCCGALVGLSGLINLGHFTALLIMNGLYPALVWLGREHWRASRQIVDYIVESTVPLFVVCMIALS